MVREKIFLLTILIMCWATVAFAQYEPIHSAVIGSSYVEYATAYSNGFKIVSSGEIPEDFLWAVYCYDDTTVNWASTTDRGLSWSVQRLTIPYEAWGHASQPSIDVKDVIPVIVYRADSAGKGDIFVDSPMDFCLPTRVSYTPDNSTLPAVVLDSSFGVHIVWQEDMPGNSDIFYYYSDNYCNPGVSINLTHSDGVFDSYPSISIFNGNEVHVIWRRDDPPCETQYSICHCYLKDGVWSSVDAIAYDWRHLDHPSLDYCHGEDSLSAAWESLEEAYFYQGNEGGGYSTPGQSLYPVVSTVGRVWSYLYWEDSTPGHEDIYAHLFYFFWRWDYNFRDFWDVKVRYPSTSGCYVIWTQGDSAPYDVMFGCEGYPTDIRENPVMPEKIELRCYPNPFNSTLLIEAPRKSTVRITDLAGRVVFTGSIIDDTTIKWIPTESQSGGVYIVRTHNDEISQSSKVVYLK
ncbi:T9SS type A sorting domain-containing protein [bacterium]|nr:T9SS type A sorting domain-containing protein [bacterium]